jgi:hypothetical protein
MCALVLCAALTRVVISGGEVVTAYAPDTVIDYLLLRHEPRFSVHIVWHIV